MFIVIKILELHLFVLTSILYVQITDIFYKDKDKDDLFQVNITHS